MFRTELTALPCCMRVLCNMFAGLDSFSALQLTTVLQKVAAAGASVLFTIHQPASDIFESFDRIILLNKGRVMYQGSVEQAPDYFGARGYPLKPRYNPADFFLVRTMADIR
jgi:ABC-type multidrug transport system ATPase subunit